MNFYFLFNAFICLFVSLCAIAREKPLVLPVTVATAIFAALFISLFELPDFESYRMMFVATPDLLSVLFMDASFDHIYGEIGYTLYTSFFKLFSEDYAHFRFFSVLLALYMKLHFLFKVAKVPSIAVVAYFSLFFYMDSFLLRQSLAAGLIALSLLSLRDDKKLGFLVLVGAATLLHVSSLAALPLLLLRRIELSKISAFCIVAVIFVLGFGGAGKYLNLLIEQGWLPDYVSGKLYRYGLGERSGPTGILRGAVVLYTSGLLFYIACSEQFKKHFSHYNLFLVSALYALFFLVAFNDFGIFGDRVFRLFGVVYAVIFSVLVSAFAYSQRAFVVLPISFVFVTISLILIPTGRVVLLD